MKVFVPTFPHNLYSTHNTQAAHMQGSTWSADDIRANAQTWSLEGDAKLLDFMKNLSKVCKVAFTMSSVI